MQAIIGQQVQPAAPLSAAWQNRVGKYWLVVNEDSPSVHLIRDGARFTLYAYDSLPGYVFAGSPILPSSIVDPSTSDTTAQMFLQIPSINGRDLNDVTIETRGGEEWVLYGNSLFRPQATVPVLPSGASTVTISNQGYAEWRQVAVPASVAISGATAWKLYGSTFALPPVSGTGDGTATVSTAGSYLMLFGSPGSAINLNVTAAQ